MTWNNMEWMILKISFKMYTDMKNLKNKTNKLRSLETTLHGIEYKIYEKNRSILME